MGVPLRGRAIHYMSSDLRWPASPRPSRSQPSLALGCGSGLSVPIPNALRTDCLLNDFPAKQNEYPIGLSGTDHCHSLVLHWVYAMSRACSGAGPITHRRWFASTRARPYIIFQRNIIAPHQVTRATGKRRLVSIGPVPRCHIMWFIFRRYALGRG